MNCSKYFVVNETIIVDWWRTLKFNPQQLQYSDKADDATKWIRPLILLQNLFVEAVVRTTILELGLKQFGISTKITFLQKENDEKGLMFSKKRNEDL